MRSLLPAHGPGTAARARPRLAAAASLALTPITHAVFRKPMAHATSGRVIVGAVLTLQFLLALYLTWFRVKAPDGARTA